MSSRELPSGCLLTLTGVVLPLLHGLCAQSLVPAWQSGELTDYLSTYFAAPVTLVFVPLFVYAAVSLGIIVGEPTSPSYSVRMGLLSGFTLSVQQLVVLTLVQPDLWWFYLAVVASVFASWGVARIGDLGPPATVTLMVGAPMVPLFFVATDFPPNPGSFVLIWVLVMLWGAPLFALVTYGYLLRHAMAQRPNRARHPLTRLALLPWIGVYLASLRLARAQIDRTYASLPTAPPHDCYVATAAARGHRWLVRPRVVSGRVVSRQMQVLKAAEWRLQDRWPSMHRRIRRGYDAVGPRLARLSRHSLSADAAYLGLKPVEWLGWAIVLSSLSTSTDTRGDQPQENDLGRHAEPNGKDARAETRRDEQASAFFHD